MTKQDIIEQLKLIKYPGFSKDIISFGMLKEISVSNENIIINLFQSTNEKNILDTIKSEIISTITKIDKSKANTAKAPQAFAIKSQNLRYFFFIKKPLFNKNK